MAWFRKRREDDSKAELLRSIFGDDWEDSVDEGPRVPTKDLLGRSFDELDDREIESEVTETLEQKNQRKRAVEALLQRPSLPDETRRQLEDELYQIESFLWLARGGDRTGELPPRHRGQ